MSTEPQYYFASGSEQRGPYRADELTQFGLRPDTLVWREGMADWQPMSALPELTALIPVAPVAAPAAGLAPQMAAAAAAGAALAGRTTAGGSEPAYDERGWSASGVPAASGTQPLSYGGGVPGGVLPASGMATASLVLGILALVSMCLGPYSVLGLPCSILAVVFGHLAKRKADRNEAGGRGIAIAGLVCGWIHVGIAAVIIVIGIGVILMFALK